MNRFSRSLPLAALALALAGSAHAAGTVRYEAQPGSKIKIDGTSTIHEWTVEVGAVGGFMEIDPAADADLQKLAGSPKVEVTVLVRGMKSGKKSMDNVMYEHMNQPQHPQIKYTVLELTAKGGSATEAKFDARGAITVAGVTRTNTMPVTISRVDKDKIKVAGQTALKMTDFGIKPPSPDVALGLIKTGDDVKLALEWVTARATAPAPAP